MGDTDEPGPQGRGMSGTVEHGNGGGQCPAGSAGDIGNPWSDLEWLACSDGKARPTQPGLFPLADGLRNRASQLRAYGNAIVPQIAAQFIKAAMEVIGDE